MEMLELRAYHDHTDEEVEHQESSDKDVEAEEAESKDWISLVIAAFIFVDCNCHCILITG